MRSPGPALVVVTLLTASPVSAATPDPNRSGVALAGQGTACHYRFRADGGLDRLTVLVTMRDRFDAPVPDCSTSVTLRTTAETLAFCTCSSPARIGRTDAEGVMAAVFDEIGGRGAFNVAVTSHCTGNIGIADVPVPFTSPDLHADCAPVNVVSMGIWAGCLPPAPYCETSDYDCDGTVGVLDLAIWAGALGIDCPLVP